MTVPPKIIISEVVFGEEAIERALESLRAFHDPNYNTPEAQEARDAYRREWWDKMRPLVEAYEAEYIKRHPEMAKFYKKEEK